MVLVDLTSTATSPPLHGETQPSEGLLVTTRRGVVSLTVGSLDDCCDCHHERSGQWWW